MVFMGVLYLLAGAGSIIYGFLQNNDVKNHMNSLFTNGSLGSGDGFIIVGGVVAVLGLVFLIAGIIIKTLKNNDYISREGYRY